MYLFKTVSMDFVFVNFQENTVLHHLNVSLHYNIPIRNMDDTKGS